LGQDDVIKAFKSLKVKDDKVWFTNTEIFEHVNCLSRDSITQSLRRLVKHNELECKKCEDYNHGFVYRLKHG